MRLTTTCGVQSLMWAVRRQMMFGRWVIFVVSLSIATFFALFFLYAVSGHLSFCSEPAQDLTRGLLDQFTCSRYSKLAASAICTLFVVGTAVLMAPALKMWCGAVVTLAVAFFAAGFLAPDLDRYPELICSLITGSLITFSLRNSNVLSAA